MLCNSVLLALRPSTSASLKRARFFSEASCCFSFRQRYGIITHQNAPAAFFKKEKERKDNEGTGALESKRSVRVRPIRSSIRIHRSVRNKAGDAFKSFLRRSRPGHGRRREEERRGERKRERSLFPRCLRNPCSMPRHAVSINSVHISGRIAESCIVTEEAKDRFLGPTTADRRPASFSLVTARAVHNDYRRATIDNDDFHHRPRSTTPSRPFRLPQIPKTNNTTTTDTEKHLFPDSLSLSLCRPF